MANQSNTSKMLERIKGLDLYELLDILPDADEKAIKKAYRKKALTCHPDKNKDDPKAKEQFQQLSDAYQVLSDADAKSAYDNVLKAKKAAALRDKKLDAKRQKLKSDLEAREKASERNFVDEDSEWFKKNEEKKFAAEIERLRKEGSRQLEEEQEYMKDLLKEQEKRTDPHQQQTSYAQQPSYQGSGKIKAKWKKDSEKRYTKDGLRAIFSKYGNVKEVVVLSSEDGKGSGLIEMESFQSAKLAAQIEIGFTSCPLKLKLLESKDEQPKVQQSFSSYQPPASSTNSLTSSNNDYESLVMRKLRQEDERRRLIKEMEEQDAREEEAERSTKT